ncbi:MAG: hypothetical protein M1818_005386 [Claussenomyces sp. TS43310]|nr:MAG: hypothetical protein M1818_005386 [Claussenomyces sp. TS43310]
MSSLVSDLLNNPVLRQARRLSRSSISSDFADPVTNQRVARDSTDAASSAETPHAAGVQPTAPALEDGRAPISSVSGGPLVASPTTENEESEVGLAVEEESHSRSTPDSLRHSSIVPLRLASLRSDRGSTDDDVSDNPSFGTPGRFQTASPISTSFNMSSSARESPAESLTRRTTQDSTHSATAGSGVQHHRNSSLPEDDGMGELRRKIVRIQSMDVASETKAMMMHQVLTQEYNKSQTTLNAKHLARPHSPSSMVSQERPSTPASLGSFNFWQANDTPPESSPMTSNHGFQLSPEDLQPTFVPLPSRIVNEDIEDAEESGGSPVEPVPQLGCPHYKRNVKLQCSSCDRWYTCRFCHDEGEDHVLKRRETKNMLCMLCGYAQRAGETCMNCGVRSAWYYCHICHLWDDDASKKHKCVERASDCDCPICGEYLFNSPQTVVFMKCGHTIHQICYKDLMKTSYKCPICSQSVVNMETQFRNLDRAIESQPMPPQFQDTQAMISCNDCYAKSLVKYHWLGLKCAVCDSYNTAQLQIMSIPTNGSGPSESDIIPGPRAELFVEDVQPLSSIRSERPVFVPRPTRRRRHSSHVHPVSSPSHPSSQRFSPYPTPQRIGRSVSPLRSPHTEELAGVAGTVPLAVEADEEDEDDLDFWGRDMRRSPRTEASNIEGEGDELEESEEDSWSEMDEEEDEEEGDDVDRMDLIGHR